MQLRPTAHPGLEDRLAVSAHLVASVDRGTCSDQGQAVVGRHHQVRVIADLADPHFATSRVALVVGPHEDATVGGLLVLLGPDELRDRRSRAVGADDQRRSQLAGGRRHACDAAAVED
jgi:hypothetical protein